MICDFGLWFDLWFAHHCCVIVNMIIDILKVISQIQSPLTACFRFLHVTWRDVCVCQGIGLHRGVTRASDYTVLLGDGHCTPTELRSDVLQCDAPESAPNVSTDDNAQCNDSFAMIVSSSQWCGYRYKWYIRCLQNAHILTSCNLAET